ncbi:MAG: hypothetical protein RL204_2351 [Bacteroidota bacterium]|jgi:hypothetical protein
MKIERVLFWFRIGGENLPYLFDRFFGLSHLLGRILNEEYKGKKIKYINLYFYTKESFELFPHLEINAVHSHGGHINFYGLLKEEELSKLETTEQKLYIWRMACLALEKCAATLENKVLEASIIIANKRGVQLGLNTDFKAITHEFEMFGLVFCASIYFKFQEEVVSSWLILEHKDRTIYECEMSHASVGAEIFLEAYKSIKLEGESLIVSGRRDVLGGPLKFDVNDLISGLHLKKN